jgi:hypothetical protein
MFQNIQAPNLKPRNWMKMKIYGVRLEAFFFWNIFGPKYDRILGVFRVYMFFKSGSEEAV